MGSVVEATVLSHVTPAMKVSCQEVFGPVVTVTPYRQFDEAIAALNQSDYGLQAGVFTQDVNKVRITSYNVCYTKLLRHNQQ